VAREASAEVERALVPDFALRLQDESARALARRLADDVVVPAAREADEKRVFPRGVIDVLAKEGILGAATPREFGGLGWDAMQTSLMYEEIGRADQSVRGFLSVHLGLVSQCLAQYGNDAQKRAWLPRLASGETFGAYALTERDAGSDAGAIATRAVPDGDGWRISGEKVWITNALSAGLFVVMATVDPALKHKGVTAFLVRGDAPGLERTRMPAVELGHRASEHAVVTLRDVRVGPDDVLGKVGGGFEVAMGGLDHGRLGVAAGAVGLLQACLDATIEFARSRRQFGKRIGDFQMVQERVADMACDTEAARMLVWKAAWKATRGEPRTREVSMAKLFATEAACKWSAEAVLLHGSRGYSNERAVERHFRDAPGLRIYEGTSQVQRIVIARDYLGREEKPA
jgi:alkylation response protein AidB-like acyl-CoA dehydrogenase